MHNILVIFFIKLLLCQCCSQLKPNSSYDCLRLNTEQEGWMMCSLCVLCYVSVYTVGAPNSHTWRHFRNKLIYFKLLLEGIQSVALISTKVTPSFANSLPSRFQKGIVNGCRVNIFWNVNWNLAAFKELLLCNCKNYFLLNVSDK